MSDIPVFPVPSIEEAFQGMVLSPAFLEAHTNSALPQPVVHPWRYNPHAADDLHRLVTKAPIGSFIGKPPIRIVFGEKWQQESQERKVITALHELAHADEYTQGIFNLHRSSVIEVPDYALRPDEGENAQFQSTAYFLMNCLREVWVECRLFPLVRVPMVTRIRREICESREWRSQVEQLRRGKLRMDERHMLLHTTGTIVWLKGVAREIKALDTPLADECYQEAVATAGLRQAICRPLVTRHQLRTHLAIMEDTTQQAAYYEGFSHVLAAVLNARIVEP